MYIYFRGKELLLRYQVELAKNSIASDRDEQSLDRTVADVMVRANVLILPKAEMMKLPRQTQKDEAFCTMRPRCIRH